MFILVNTGLERTLVSSDGLEEGDVHIRPRDVRVIIKVSILN